MGRNRYLSGSVEVTGMLRDRSKLPDKKSSPVLYDALLRIAATQMRKERGARTPKPTALAAEPACGWSGRVEVGKQGAVFCIAPHPVNENGLWWSYARRRNARKWCAGAFQLPCSRRHEPIGCSGTYIFLRFLHNLKQGSRRDK
jgi:hypothetical protein